jgi:hypothetical protein
VLLAVKTPSALILLCSRKNSLNCAILQEGRCYSAGIRPGSAATSTTSLMWRSLADTDRSEEESS